MENKDEIVNNKSQENSLELEFQNALTLNARSMTQFQQALTKVIKSLPKAIRDKVAQTLPWWQCPDPSPVQTGIDQLDHEIIFKLAGFIVIGGGMMGYNTAAKALHYFLSKKGRDPNTDILILDAEIFSSAPLLIQRLGPSSNPKPTEGDLKMLLSMKRNPSGNSKPSIDGYKMLRRFNRTITDYSIVLSLPGHHHAVFMTEVLRMLQDGEKKPGEKFEDLTYIGVFSFHTKPRNLKITNPKLIQNHIDLRFAIGQGYIESKVNIEVRFQDEKIEMRYLSWKCQIFDIYNWKDGEIANIKDFACLPHSDLNRLRDAKLAAEFYTTSKIWQHLDPGVKPGSGKWYEIPNIIDYKPPPPREGSDNASPEMG